MDVLDVLVQVVLPEVDVAADLTAQPIVLDVDFHDVPVHQGRVVKVLITVFATRSRACQKSAHDHERKRLCERK